MMAGEFSSAKRVCWGRSPMRHMNLHFTSGPSGMVALLVSACSSAFQCPCSGLQNWLSFQIDVMCLI